MKNFEQLRKTYDELGQIMKNQETLRNILKIKKNYEKI